MPWKVTSSDQCSAAKPYALVRQTDGHVEGCHETKDKAMAQMKALQANVKKSPQHIAGLLHHLADLIADYGMPQTSMMPHSQSTLAPMDMPTIHPAVKVCKVNEDEQLVFGWASISTDSEGGLVVDSDGETIAPEELEKAVYDYVLEAREAGEMHKGESIGQMVESFVLTPEKASAMGLTIPSVTGWWFGVKVDDSEVFDKVKDGTYKMFSIQGVAESEELEAA